MHYQPITSNKRNQGLITACLRFLEDIHVTQSNAVITLNAVASPALGHWGTSPRLPTILFLVHFRVNLIVLPTM